MHDVAMVTLEAVLLWAMYIHRKYSDGVGGGGRIGLIVTTVDNEEASRFKLGVRSTQVHCKCMLK